LPTKESAYESLIEFNDQIEDETLRHLAYQGSEPKSQPIELDPSEIFITSSMGYSIVSTKGSPGKDHGWVKLSSHNFAKPKSLLYSIYFTQNQKIIDNENNFLVIDEGSFNKIIFESQAEEMSTGAPIFDKNWNLLGIHIGNPKSMTSCQTNAIFEMSIMKRKLEAIRSVAIMKELDSFCKERNKMAYDVLKFSG